MDNINREHPEYVLKKAMWKKYRVLYSGGENMREHAFEYLVRRSKEPNDVYQERLCRVFYENYIGSTIDWYAATLLRREPSLIFDGTNESGKQFYNEFAEDCDLKGTTLSEFFRQQLVHTLVFGRTYIALDFPRSSQPAANRAEEDATGMSRAFLVEYTPDEVINWSHDQDGNLAWIVIRTSCLRQEKVTDSGWRRETRWIHYDQQNFRIYSSIEGGDVKGGIQLIDEGRHALAAQGRVPVFQLKVTEGLWLMNKAALLQLEHFNKSNALSWALTMGLFAMPVVYSDREWNQIVGDSYYIQLGPNDKFGWAEPTGHVYQIAADNLERLKDEIYRVCYLMTQAGGSQPSPLAQSGVSKQRDFAITQEVLRAYGDAVKETIKQVLRAIESARQDGLLIDVSGLDEFDIGDFGNELDDAKKLLELGIGSETLKKQLFKKLALKYFCDARQDIKTQIATEIDASFGKSG
jgi:hypothetical protein